MHLDILQIFMVLREHSTRNYLVGGCVRDLQLGRDPKDYDIVTETPMGILQGAFEHAGWRVQDAGKQFLVLTISKGGNQYEIANFRKDGVYSDGRRPDTVEIGTLEEDAARRDFTVNALYLEPFTGEILDPTGFGRKDLKDRRLRFIGRARDRIREDYLRIFRYYRFLARGFQPHPGSLRACREMFNEAYPLITPERVRSEIEKMVT